jgi:hypothetical protein
VAATFSFQAIRASQEPLNQGPKFGFRGSLEKIGDQQIIVPSSRPHISARKPFTSSTGAAAPARPWRRRSLSRPRAPTVPHHSQHVETSPPPPSLLEKGFPLPERRNFTGVLLVLSATAKGDGQHRRRPASLTLPQHRHHQRPAFTWPSLIELH